MVRRRGSAFMLFLLVFLLVFNVVLHQVIIPQISTLLEHFGGNPNSIWRLVSSPWFIIFQQLVGLILPLTIWLAFHKEKLSIHLPNARLGKVNLTLIIFLSIFLQPVLMFISGLTGLFFPNQVSGVVMDMMAQPYLLLILAIAVTPAICEEIVFRGYIQSEYSHHSFKKAALINGLFFAIIHLSLQQFFYAFAAGIIFAYMVHYTRSIRAGIIVHFLMNASQITMARVISYVLEVAAEFGINYEADIAVEMELAFGAQLASIMGIGLVAMLATPCAIILFNVFLSHNRQRNMEYDMKQLLNDNQSLDSHAPDSLIHDTSTPQEHSVSPTEKSTYDHPTTSGATDEYNNYVEDELEEKEFSLLKYIDPFFVAIVVLYALLMFFQ